MSTRIMRCLWLFASLAISLQFVCAASPTLKCRADGTFKVLMMSDMQDGAHLDPRATALMEKLLDTEKPDFVVLAGDNIAGYDINTVDEVKQAIACIAAPMEQRKIPWAMVYGNHDQNHVERTKLSKEDVLKIYQRYTYNRNVRGDKSLHGVGNSNYLVLNAAGKAPVFNLWLLDSGDYALGGYDWIRPDQITWYVETSERLERKYHDKIPGLMFFHIPLPEFTELALTGNIIGERYETDEGPSVLNSGLFAAALERGDVKGIFCGHAHTDSYVGTWYGIQLGLDASVGYAAYNLPDDDPKTVHTRGGRVFLIQQSDPGHFKTWMRFADGTTSQQ